jgi:hypothetical protein
MNAIKALGLAAIGALLMLAVPAQALTLANPGAAVAIQDSAKQTTTVGWHHHHHWHEHHHWHHHHW